jgi:hypothetical protein
MFYPIRNLKQAILKKIPFVISRHVSKYWLSRASPWGLTTHFPITTLTKKGFQPCPSGNNIILKFALTLAKIVHAMLKMCHVPNL